jgi:hypothetical protein
MKTQLKYLSFPLLVWLITLFVSAIGIMFTIGSEDAGVFMIFIWFLISIPASLPAFIIFLVGYFMIRKKEQPNMTAKMKILGVNLLNMAIYFLIVMVYNNEMALPGLWVVIPSCLLILVLPLPVKPLLQPVEQKK